MFHWINKTLGLTGIDEKDNIRIMYCTVLFFLGLNFVAWTADNYYLLLLPLAGIILYLVLFKLELLLKIIVFLTPLSVPLRFIKEGLGTDIALPTEPLLFGIFLLFLIQLLAGRKLDKKIILHPISIAIFLNLAWMLATTITSTMPLVSLKFLLSRGWFVVCFYFLMIVLFRNIKNIYIVWWLYIIAFTLVIFYTIANQVLLGGLLDRDAAYASSQPFSNDHTSFAVIIAMYLPVLVGFIFIDRWKKLYRTVAVFLTLLFIFALIVSFTRAAWISITGAFCVWILFALKINWKIIVAGTALLGYVAINYSGDIYIMLKENTQDSSEKYSQHLESITNISTDASNVERLNRWNCAIRMYHERPWQGWGPGTYMFMYAPFQLFTQETVISTNEGDVGNAHSEYLGPLAESGLPGMLTFILIVVLTIYTAIMVYLRANSKEHRIIIMSALVGLITYYLHGFLNNFLDTDKASLPFWGFTAIIVVMDVYFVKKGKRDNVGQAQR